MIALAPVRLIDIPLKVRTKAMRKVFREEGHKLTKSERIGLIAAAIRPSNRTYWVPKDLVEEVKGVANA